MHLAVDWEHLKVVAAYDDKIIKIYDLKQVKKVKSWVPLV